MAMGYNPREISTGILLFKFAALHAETTLITSFRYREESPLAFKVGGPLIL